MQGHRAPGSRGVYEPANGFHLPLSERAVYCADSLRERELQGFQPAERFFGRSTNSPGRFCRAASMASCISAPCRNEAFQMAM